MDLATEILIHGAWLGSLLFVARYSRVRWRDSPEGINVMAFMLVIAAVLSLAVLAIWWPDMPGRPTLRVLSWAGIFGVVWHRNYVFDRRHRSLRDNRSGRRETDQHGSTT
jgi:hypothetical protein